jgi:cell division septum initiation protein DivIVA
VALDRQSIEKKDFPIGRRGYDPDVVDAHLSALADEVEELRASSRRRSETLASAASDQVRAIVEAAENSAAAIQRQAENEAREIKAEASSEAQSTREQATEQAREYVGNVSESTGTMLQRLDAMESELSALIESLRTGSNRLNADLQLLEGNLSEVHDAVGPRPRFEPEETSAGPEEQSMMTEEPSAVAGIYEPHEEVAAAPYERLESEPSHPTAAEPGSAPADRTAAPTGPGSGPTESADGADDTEGARLIALNMALNGTPREETDRYLAENFQLADRSGLLDEVYASVEG